MQIDSAMLLGCISCLAGVVAYLWKSIEADRKRTQERLEACEQRYLDLVEELRKRDSG